MRNITPGYAYEHPSTTGHLRVIPSELVNCVVEALVRFPDSSTLQTPAIFRVVALSYTPEIDRIITLTSPARCPFVINAAGIEKVKS